MLKDLGVCGSRQDMTHGFADSEEDTTLTVLIASEWLELPWIVSCKQELVLVVQVVQLQWLLCVQRTIISNNTINSSYLSVCLSLCLSPPWISVTTRCLQWSVLITDCVCLCVSVFASRWNAQQLSDVYWWWRSRRVPRMLQCTIVLSELSALFTLSLINLPAI